jgi:predicted adenine nucleotide alpha hydrolase (AANH) superfamily ATPase
MKVLVHICCAVCATACLERLRDEGRDVSGYFYNPNIHPQEEYLIRLRQVQGLARRESLPLLTGDYDLDAWFAATKGLESEPEAGKRCARCFKMRLEKTALKAKAQGFTGFTTTLTISPHKNARLINEIGRDIGQDLFLAHDFKKQDGFKRARQLSRQYNLYHQDYCGCVYSLKERQKYERLHQKTRSGRHKHKTA